MTRNSRSVASTIQAGDLEESIKTWLAQPGPALLGLRGARLLEELQSHPLPRSIDPPIWGICARVRLNQFCGGDRGSSPWPVRRP
jgi:hypothetical protein